MSLFCPTARPDFCCRNTQGLTAKTDSEGTLLDIPLLLTPKIMFHFDAVKTGWKCLQNDIRARGRGVVIAAQIACAVVVVWVLSDHVAANFPAALERVRLFRVCGWAGVVVRPIWNAVDRLLSSLVLSLNPFKGAGEATRLPPVMVSVRGPLKVCNLMQLKS